MGEIRLRLNSELDTLGHYLHAEITTEDAIKIFRDRALKQDTDLTARKRRPERA